MKRKAKTREIEMPLHIAMMQVDDYTKDELFEIWKEEREFKQLHKKFKSKFNVSEEIENE